MDKNHFFLNSFFAISLDTHNKKEHIIYCIGYADEFFNAKAKNVHRESRDLGEFIFDFSSSIDLYVAEDRINLLYDYLSEYMSFVESNTSRWKYDDELFNKHKSFTDMIDRLKAPLLSDNFFNAQKHLSLNERHEYNSYELMKKCYPEIISDLIVNPRLFSIGDCRYIATDFQFIELFRYYLDEIYFERMFPRRCMSCGSLFLSGKSHGDVLCSEKCRRKKKAQNSMAYYRRLSDNELLYTNLYSKWKHRIDSAEEKHTISPKGIEQLRQGLKELTEINRTRANDRKRGSIPEKDGVPDYESFDKLYHDVLMSKDQYLYQLFNSVKAD